MEKQDRNRYAQQVFTALMKRMIHPGFSFPKGGIAIKSVDSCMNVLDSHQCGKLSRERIADYCICQVYAISKYDGPYYRKWNVMHSFGGKAIERFTKSHSRIRFYEDEWLRKKGITRAGLLDEFRDKREHPLAKFIYPQYEEPTKQRLYNTEAGFCICQLSTMLYTPFSPSCQGCDFSERCRRMVLKNYPELYRLRREGFVNYELGTPKGSAKLITNLYDESTGL